ncbi:hypothetical protein Hypma_002121 [Hypsizygus marmoreus]|uniref:Uncharacterized protein n=1 Tax=Hypsizygus marmoreus TaxID=39966 RepID=A0A369K5D6_HYPMA|nr:hypothetical protein Hypma_002121 [Hypsizygus marmoreus]
MPHGASLPPRAEDAPTREPSPPNAFDWNVYETFEDTTIPLSAEEESVAKIAQALLDHWEETSIGTNEDEEGEYDAGDEELNEPSVTVDDGGDQASQDAPRKRAKTRDAEMTSKHWFPWPDKILDLFLWLLKVNNVDDVPSVKTLQSVNASLQKMCGIDSIPYDGALGHRYYVNNLAQIIAQEMANPKVRPHLSFYPEDSGTKLSEARQGARWLHEVPDEQLTPMARIGNRDYFIHEPAMLRDERVCMPHRWFTRGGVLFAKCWELVVVSTEHSSAWRVLSSNEFEVAQHEFLKNFPELESDAEMYKIPKPSLIQDMFDRVESVSSPWMLTNPIVGNRWRALAKGSRVVSFAMWMYCDDTSGNVSKKWNEHNSFLFTPAGLPREQSQKEYNIHFLSTSNLAPPLEMMDGVVSQLETAQEHGIWAWDCEFNEPILIIPMVLALLGDNPMQSEFACHIGLRGKLFCRACWVKGTDATQGQSAGGDGDSDKGRGDDDGSEGDEEDHNQGARDPDAESSSGARHAASDGGASVNSDATQGSKMRDRITAFIKPGRQRTKIETTDTLKTYFVEAKTLDTKTKVKKMRTRTGIKDTFQMFHLDKLYDSYKKKRGTAKKQEALDAQIASLPNDPDVLLSPVWRIKEGLDPHHDTPVEILHVILLGFVKYLWRDVVQNQLKKKQDKKDLLETRLSSLNVSGLGISPLAGHTLVQYSGSLTGRDFRAIAQVAPFVIYDLVSPECLATWVALSKLIPLIWQPDIDDVNTHLPLLEKEITNFLLCAARWTNRWFNKPKFHILVHLVDHIRQFGPAILFATEAFESFNAIIRAKSVHSNRHAPSRDIAYGFAQGNRIRHILSHGLFVLQPLRKTPDNQPTSSNPRFSRNVSDWKAAGAGPRSLVSAPNTVTQYLGLGQKATQIQHGICTSDKAPPRLFANTLTGQQLPGSFGESGQRKFRTNVEVQLFNGDCCRVGDHVVARDHQQPNVTFIANVVEIIQQVGSVSDMSRTPDAILVQTATTSRSAVPYGMPAIDLQDEWRLLSMADVICTVNAQHNCAENRCTDSGTQPVYQERQLTEHTRPIIQHSRNPRQLVLNTAQMRDARYLQKFRIASEPLDAEEILEQSVFTEIAIRKAASKVVQKEKQTGGTPRRITSQLPTQPRPQPRPAPRRLDALRGVGATGT